jgi:SAM-dependent methyltransferase
VTVRDERLAAGSPHAIWDEHAEWWQATFTDGADPEYEEQILPLLAGQLAGAERILDIGCGEGQVARRAAAAERRALVVGIDVSTPQLRCATRRGGDVVVARGEGERLPFRAGSFDAAVCCLVIEHIEDPEALIAEAVRVLVPGGRFLLLVNHPLFQGPGSGLVDDHILGERYWRVGPYLTEERSLEEVDPSVQIPFAHRPLSGWVNAVTARGAPLTRLDEPAPPRTFLAGALAPELEAAIPRLCCMRFEKTG